MIRHLLPLAALLFLAVYLVSPVGANPTPCEDAYNLPDPPIRGPEPLIGGAVFDAGTTSGIEGATLGVYRCSEGEASLVEWLTSDEQGDYLSSALTPGYYYYVEVLLTGPLAGKSPAEGCENPSDPVGLGSSVLDLDFYFE